LPVCAAAYPAVAAVAAALAVAWFVLLSTALMEAESDCKYCDIVEAISDCAADPDVTFSLAAWLGLPAR
jgi:hypothetical protein